MCSFLHIHTSQGSPKASFSWCFLFNTSTHHRVHQKRVPADVSFSTQPHITGFTKYVFQLVCPFQHIHILQGLPKAFSSWCVLFNTTTHHWVHQKRVPAGVSFSTHPHITGFIKSVFQLVCHFQHNHTSQGSSKRVPAGVSFSTHPHITGFIKSMFQLVCPFLHIHTSQGAPKACSSWCVISSHP